MILSITPYTQEHFLPHSEVFFRALFSVMAEMQAQRGVASRTLKFRFVGTGERRLGVSITSLAIGIWHPGHCGRVPHSAFHFLAVQTLVATGRSGSLVIGSTERSLHRIQRHFSACWLKTPFLPFSTAKAQRQPSWRRRTLVHTW